MARTYLVVIDDSPEARVALRFAARRAAKTGGEVDILAVVEPQAHHRAVVGRGHLQPAVRRSVDHLVPPAQP